MTDDSVVSKKSGRPVATFICMALALVAVFLLPDWAGSGAARPIWFMAVPIGLGVLGAIFALRRRSWIWAVVSIVWGFALIQLLVVVITLVSGP